MLFSSSPSVSSALVRDCFLGASLLLTFVSAADTFAQEGGVVREGYLAHTWPNEEEALYSFRVYADGTITIREGVDQATPTLTIPRNVVRLLGEQVELIAPGDPKREERLSVAMDRNTLWFRWSKRMNLVLVLGTGVLLVGFLIGLGAWGWVRRERSERLRIAESRAHLAAGQEAERARLAHEIHDGSLQDLHGIHRRVGLLCVQGVGLQSEEVTDEAVAITEEIEEDLLGVIAELRAIMADLQPPALGPFGLGAAIRAHTERFQRRYPTLAFDLVLPEIEPELPNPVRLALFRICQEAMSNAAKHSGGERVRVRVWQEGGTAVLEVTDDGSGFVAPLNLISFAESGSYGLSNMRARAEAVGGRLKVESVPSSGTSILVTVQIESVKGRRGVAWEAESKKRAFASMSA